MALRAAGGREIEVLGCFEVLQGLLEVCSVFSGIGDGELVACHWVSLVRL